jgi:hypothetical protein
MKAGTDETEEVAIPSHRQVTTLQHQQTPGPSLGNSPLDASRNNIESVGE